MPLSDDVIREAKQRLSTATDDELLDAIAELALMSWIDMTTQQRTVQTWITDELETRHPAYGEASEDWVNDFDDDREHAEFTLDYFGRPS